MYGVLQMQLPKNCIAKNYTYLKYIFHHGLIISMYFKKNILLTCVTIKYF
jgi:hypothetical protein